MRSIIAISFAVGFLFVAQSFGQSDRGNISGMVQDSWGVAMANATVEAKNVATGSVAKAVSNAAGKYALADLAAGVYDVTVAVPAVRAFEKRGVTVAAAKTLELNIKLQESTQLSTLGEDTLGAIADRKRHNPPAGPTPRTVDGKPDLSGTWWSPATTDAGKPEWLPEAQAVAKRRLDNNAVDNPQAQCLPSATTRLGPL